MLVEFRLRLFCVCLGVFICVFDCVYLVSWLAFDCGVFCLVLVFDYR